MGERVCLKGNEDLGREGIGEEGVVIVEAVEDWREKGGPVDGSWVLVKEIAGEDEITIVETVGRGWFWEDAEFDGVINEGMDDWDDKKRKYGGVVKGEELGARSIWQLVFDGAENKEANDRDLYVQVFSKLKMWFLRFEISIFRLEMR